MENGKICRKRKTSQKCIVMYFSGFTFSVVEDSAHCFRRKWKRERDIPIQIGACFIPAQVCENFSVQLHSLGRQNHCSNLTIAKQNPATLQLFAFFLCSQFFLVLLLFRCVQRFETLSSHLFLLPSLSNWTDMLNSQSALLPDNNAQRQETLMHLWNISKLKNIHLKKCWKTRSNFLQLNTFMCIKMTEARSVSIIWRE